MAGIPNSDGGLPSEFFGIDLAQGTGAPGSPVPGDAPPLGAVVGSPVVSAVGVSSQVPAGLQRMDVSVGDSSGFSDDVPSHANAMLPGPQGAYLSTGAGQGSVHDPHPNASRS